MVALSFIWMYILTYNGRLTLALSTDWTYHSRAGWKIDLLVSGATIFAVGALGKTHRFVGSELEPYVAVAFCGRHSAYFTSILSGVNVSCNAESNVLRRADNQPQSMWQPAYTTGGKHTPILKME